MKMEEKPERAPATRRMRDMSTPSAASCAIILSAVASLPVEAQSDDMPPSRTMDAACAAAMPSATSTASSGITLPGSCGSASSRKIVSIAKAPTVRMVPLAIGQPAIRASTTAWPSGESHSAGPCSTAISQP